MRTRMLLTLAQAVVLAGMLLVFVGAIATARVEPAERLHWPSRPATTVEQLNHMLDQPTPQPSP